MFKIGPHEIGSGRTFVIAEVGQAHNGVFAEALAFIDAVAEAGVDAVKFQCHIAEEESSAKEPLRIPIPGYTRRYDYWKAMEFTQGEWLELSMRAYVKGIEFLVSPFSLEALERMKTFVPAWKVASGELTNRPLLEAMVATGKPILLSTGMATWAEADTVASGLQDEGEEHEYPILVFQTTSEYPCPPEQVGLNQMLLWQEQGLFEVGLSDHSGSPYTGLAAVALGADALEVHVSWDKRASGPDISSSLTMKELETLVLGTRWIERIRNNPVDKDAMAKELAPMRDLFTKSAFAVSSDSGIEEFFSGYTFIEEDIRFFKPGTGISPEAWPEYAGRPLRRPVKAGQMLSEDDFE